MTEKAEPWKRELLEMAKLWDERFEALRQEIGGKFSKETPQAQAQSSEEGGGGEELPQLYRCTGKDCKFATDDLPAFVDHVFEEKFAEKLPIGATTPLSEEVPKKRHETIEDYLNCPECRPRWEEAFTKRGWTPPKPAEEKKKEAEIV